MWATSVAFQKVIYRQTIRIHSVLGDQFLPPGSIQYTPSNSKLQEKAFTLSPTWPFTLGGAPYKYP